MKKAFRWFTFHTNLNLSILHQIEHRDRANWALWPAALSNDSAAVEHLFYVHQNLRNRRFQRTGLCPDPGFIALGFPGRRTRSRAGWNLLPLSRRTSLYYDDTLHLWIFNAAVLPFNLAGGTAHSQRNHCSIRPVLAHPLSGIFILINRNQSGSHRRLFLFILNTPYHQIALILLLVEKIGSRV